MTFSSIRRSPYSRFISFYIMVSFVATMVITPKSANAQGILGLPEPGKMVNLSVSYVPLMLTGLTVHPENPLLMDFIVSTGNDVRAINNRPYLKAESDRLIKYFLACLTIPENDQWVNLSPYEKQRIVPEDLGQTVLGQDMLAQDYLLKQLTASLIYPEKNLGKTFWDKVYAQAQETYGTTQIPLNTFNKVWILPQYAKVYTHNNTVFVVKSHLNVMLDEDYLAMSKHQHQTQRQPGDMFPRQGGGTCPQAGCQPNEPLNLKVRQSSIGEISPEGRTPQGNNQNASPGSPNILASNIIRQIILPAIEHEVNTGKNFAQMRQIYNSMILAVWFKNNLKQALLNQVYSDKSKVNGVNVDDPTIKEKIYKQYLEAYKKGVFNYIKEEPSDTSLRGVPTLRRGDEAISEGTTIPRKYFSGGLEPFSRAMISDESGTQAEADLTQRSGDVFILHGSELGISGFNNIQSKAKSSAAMVTNLGSLLTRSNSLYSRMEAANVFGDSRKLDETFEEARIHLQGNPHNSPYLFAFKSAETTKVIPASSLSIRAIKTRVNRYLPKGAPRLSTKDAETLIMDKPFSLEDVSKNNTREGRLANEARSQQVALIWEAAVKAGLMGTQYFVSNIKKFSANSPLPYMEYLRSLTQEFNGHVVFFLSVEESDQVLLGDMAGEGTAIAAVRKVLGDDFFKTANINIITDGGKKERGGSSTGLNSYAGLFPSPHGINYYRRAMQLLAKVRMQHSKFGEGKVYWTASDGDYQVGDIKYGQNFEAELQNDSSWSLAVHGVAEKIVEDDEKGELFKEIELAEDIGKISEDSTEFPAIAKALRNIRAKKLTELGENFSDPETGQLVAFVEKPSAVKILQMLKEHNTNSIIPNAFLVVYNLEAFMTQQNELERVDSRTGKALREFGGSYFDFVVGSQFETSDAFNKLSQEEQDQIRMLHRILPASRMIAANQGGIGAFTDRGKTEFLVHAYYEEVQASKRKGESGLIQRGKVNIGKNVKLTLAPGATAILENVSIETEGDQEIEIVLSNGTFLQNTILRLNGNTHFGERMVMLNSRIQGNIELQPDNHDIVVEGMIFSPYTVQDLTKDGSWDKPQSLELYSGEMVISVLKLDGTRYINRLITLANYKGEGLSAVFKRGKQDWEEAKRLHPRLGLNLESVTPETTQWIAHKNWQGQGNQLVDIAHAKPWINYDAMLRSIRAILTEVKESGSNAAMTGHEVDRIFAWPLTLASIEHGVSGTNFRTGFTELLNEEGVTRPYNSNPNNGIARLIVPQANVEEVQAGFQALELLFNQNAWTQGYTVAMNSIPHASDNQPNFEIVFNKKSVGEGYFEEGSADFQEVRRKAIEALKVAELNETSPARINAFKLMKEFLTEGLPEQRAKAENASRKAAANVFESSLKRAFAFGALADFLRDGFPEQRVAAIDDINGMRENKIFPEWAKPFVALRDFLDSFPSPAMLGAPSTNRSSAQVMFAINNEMGHWTSINVFYNGRQIQDWSIELAWILANHSQKQNFTYSAEAYGKVLMINIWDEAMRSSKVDTQRDSATLVPGGIDLNSRHLNMESSGEKVNITFDPAMIAQFKRGDFSGVRIQILDVVPISLMPLLGLKEDEEPGQLARV